MVSGQKASYGLAIIGAGRIGSPGGIMMGVALMEKLGYESFMIYDKASDFGGSWLDNSYPGSASDTAAHFYVPSTHLNPNWSSAFPSQPELLAYWHALSSRFSLHAHASFHTRVVSAVWNSHHNRYDLDLQDTVTGKHRTEHARFFVSAIGLVSEPRYPEAINGLSLSEQDDLVTAFQGIGGCWHSARWRHDIDFRGKRVAVIGNSASAAQFIPHLSVDPSTHVVNFCRTPNWFVYSVCSFIVPPFLSNILNASFTVQWRYPQQPRPRYSPVLRWILAYIPFALKVFRLWVILVNYGRPIWHTLRQKIKSGGKESREADLIAYMKRTAPPRYHAQLQPNYPMTCRRPILDAGYYAALHRPNLELCWEKVTEIIPTGLRLADERDILFDVIVLSTGFVTGKCSFLLRGENGETLNEFWKSEGRPIAHRGVCVPGFPNFFVIAGPNTVTRNGSAVFTHEVEVDYIVQLLACFLCSPSLSTTLRVRPAAYAAFNADLASRLAQGSKLAAGCPPSWFNADGGKGPNFSTWPGSLYGFWWAMRRVRWEEYDVTES